jgi:hypothetical protein
MARKPQIANANLIMSEQNGGSEPRPPAALTGAKLKADQTAIAIEAITKLHCRLSVY